MYFEIRKFIAFNVILVILGHTSCEKFKLYQTDRRVSSVSKSQDVRSLLECSVLFENDMDSLSFNYNKEIRICELSNKYVEGSTAFFTGWNVYSPIVNGGWSTWLSWSSCSVTCRDGTRSRSRTCSNPSPSNGELTCQGLATENGVCNERDCYLASDYYFGINTVTQQEAVAICEQLSARLVIIDSEEELEFLETQVSELNHWIGVTCTSGWNCKWVDGRSVIFGFTAWAPNEPNGHDCVYIGYQVNKWDVYCEIGRIPLCEYI